MTWAVRTDGANDYFDTGGSITLFVGESLYLDLTPEAGNSGGEYRLFSESSTQLISMRSTSVILRVNQSGAGGLSVSSYTQPLVDQRFELEIFRDATGYDVYLDAVFIGRNATTSALVFNRFGGIYTGDGFAGLIHNVKINSNINWDATASSHTAGTPILTDTISAVNATGVNMPTDGSAWVDLGGGGISLTVDSLSQLQAIDQVTLTQNSIISIGGLSQVQTVEQVTLQQSGTLSINNLQQIQTIDQINLTQAHIVSVNDLSQLQTIDQVSLNQGNTLSVNDTDQLQTVDQVNLSTAGTMAINNASQAQTLEQLVLAIAGTVAINNLSQSQLLEQLNLTQANVISVDNLSQAQLLQSINFNGVVVGYLQGALTIVSAYNGSIKLTNPLTGEIRIL
mgnify:CR=1 FL=1|tara:strand:- start:2022 stop:3209 length:1188 start_codon:yes stop_codon:yes gene_type:complete